MYNRVPTISPIRIRHGFRSRRSSPGPFSDDAPAQAAPSDASALLKAALAKKNQAQLYPQRKIHDKGQRPGMAPRGTRRSMGKR